MESVLASQPDRVEQRTARDGADRRHQAAQPDTLAIQRRCARGILASDAQSLLASTRQVQTATPDQIDQSRSAWENELVSVDGSESTTADALNLPDSAPRS